MATVEVIEEIAASADAVWGLAGDFGGLEALPAIERCEVEGEGVGCVRTLVMKGGSPVQERLEAYDPDARTYAYSIVADNPLPLDDYLADVKIVDLGPDRARIEWRGSYRPRGVSEDEAGALVEGIYRGAIRAYQKLLEK